MVPPYELVSDKLPGVASWSECRYWWPAAVAFIMQSFLTFFTGGFTLFIFVVEIIEAAGGSRRAAGVIVVLFGVAKLLATLGVVAAIDDTDRRPLLAVCCVGAIAWAVSSMAVGGEALMPLALATACASCWVVLGIACPLGAPLGGSRLPRRPPPEPQVGDRSAAAAAAAADASGLRSRRVRDFITELTEERRL